jgi:hypothetical protein
VANVRRAVGETERLFDVGILFNMGVEESRVDVKTRKLEVVSRGNVEENTKARDADNRKGLGVVDAFALATTFGNKASLVP